MWEVRELVRMAGESGVATQMGNQAHAAEPIRRVVELVRAGIIGDVTEAHVWTNRPGWPQGMACASAQGARAGECELGFVARPRAASANTVKGYRAFQMARLVGFRHRRAGRHGVPLDGYGVVERRPRRAHARLKPSTAAARKESPPKWAVIDYQFPATRASGRR